MGIFIILFTFSTLHICYIYAIVNVMAKILFICLFFFCGNLFSQQEDIIASEYFKNGEFEKAIFEYSRLLNQKPNNTRYILQLVKAYRELERYDDAKNLLLEIMSRSRYARYFVELGYNYQLKDSISQAKDNYQKAIELYPQ